MGEDDCTGAFVASKEGGIGRSGSIGLLCSAAVVVALGGNTGRTVEVYDDCISGVDTIAVVGEGGITVALDA